MTEKRLANLNKIYKKCIANLRAPKQMTVTEWADKYRRLSAENSAEAGRWRTTRTPYLKDIMDAFTDPKVHRIVVVSSSQIGKTELELNMIGYCIDIDPGPIMFVHPKLDAAEDFSKRRMAPMIRDTPRLKSKVAAVKGRDSNNSIRKKSYPGGMITITGSNSPADLASVPARYIFGDERDRWTRSAGTEGDPWKLLEARTTTFYNRKMVEVSTPTIKGQSPIADSFELGTKEYWSVKCPECGEFNYIRFDNIKFEFTSEKQNGVEHYHVSEAKYACPHCGCISEEDVIKKSEYKWISENPGAYDNGVRSFWINAFASPWVGWKKICLEFLESKDTPEKLQTFFNTKLGELWELRTEIENDEDLKGRRENYEAELPDGVLCLTCGVDTQDNRLEYEVVGHGRWGENWGIEKGIISGKPDQKDDESVWARLDRVIDKKWSYKNGTTLKISITFIDSGGHYTQDVYEECSKRLNKRVFAIKGKGGEGIPYTKPPSKVDVTKEDARGYTKIIGKAWLYVLGVDSGKEKIMSALKVLEPGARYCHFPMDSEKGYDDLFFSGLLSEKMVYSNGRWKWEKLPGHNRNEALDCRNYANAALKVLNPNFDLLEAKLKGTQTSEKPQEKIYKKQKRNKISSEDW